MKNGKRISRKCLCSLCQRQRNIQLYEKMTNDKTVDFFFFTLCCGETQCQWKLLKNSTVNTEIVYLLLQGFLKSLAMKLWAYDQTLRCYCSFDPVYTLNVTDSASACVYSRPALLWPNDVGSISPLHLECRAG